MSKKRALTKKSTPDAVDLGSYSKLLEQIKTDILQTQLRAALTITKELIMFYWRTGKSLAHKVKEEGWGAKAHGTPIKRLKRRLSRYFRIFS
jgi:hypothetical protein